MRNVDYHGVFARKLQENCVFQAILLGSSQNSALRLGSMTLLGQGEQRGNVGVITVGDPELPFHPGRVLVRFKGDTGPRVIPTPNPIAAIARYRADNSVLYEPDYVLHVDTTTPTDPLWPQQWDMAKISAPQAWDTQINAGDVIVAVIDTGIDYTHPDLQGNLWVNPVGGHDYNVRVCFRSRWRFPAKSLAELVLQHLHADGLYAQQELSESIRRLFFLYGAGVGSHRHYALCGFGF